MLDAFEKIDFHFNGNDLGVHWGGKECRKATGRVGKHRYDPAMNHAMDLLVQFQYGHTKDHPAPFGFHQLEAEMVDGIAVAQSFIGSRQRRFA